MTELFGVSFPSREEIQKKNKALVKSMPFLDVDGVITWIDTVPVGWREETIKMFRELRKELWKTGKLKDFEIISMQEYHGGLQLEVNNHSDAVKKIIAKHANKLMLTCARCGKDATLLSRGHPMPFCEKCANEMIYSKWIFDPIFPSK